MQILGIDIGGTGIKGAPVETETGTMMAERYRLPTPKGAKPTPVAQVVNELALHFDWLGLIGCGFPAVIRNGVAESAANIDPWIGNVTFSPNNSLPVCVVNDADTAGLAEVTFGAGRISVG
jgi:polyphosphate glucokinase